ncbi:MauE/DoxX family redox-associated membrane protein [Saccharothrix xinjiangensis]|uniref:MauE/DoxX family redox-associated membrane protein n=1 Tax=Saccharothrix xinjiangensis TaxID=204798 RepID=A0ABV9Y6J0_9PSEU
MFAVGGALLLVFAALGHLRGRRALAVLELVVAASVVVTPHAVAVLYAAFAVHLARLKKRRPGAPCGCFRGEGPVTWWTVGRAVAFAVGAAAEPAAPPLIALSGGFVLAMVGYLLPQVADLRRRPSGAGGTTDGGPGAFGTPNRRYRSSVQ